MHLHKLYTAEIHFSKTTRGRKQGQLYLPYCHVHILKRRNKSSAAQFLRFRVHSRAMRKRCGAEGSLGAPHGKQPARASFHPKTGQRGARETHTCTSHAHSKPGKLLEVNKQPPPASQHSQKATQAECLVCFIRRVSSDLVNLVGLFLLALFTLSCERDFGSL